MEPKEFSVFLEANPPMDRGVAWGWYHGYGSKVAIERVMANQKPVVGMGFDFPVYDGAGIEEQAIDQMRQATRIPVAVKGALMPDGHFGYSLPIGGVLALRGAVSPAAVGYDIGCSMALTIFDAAFDWFDRSELIEVLVNNTAFGRRVQEEQQSDPVLAKIWGHDLKVVRDLFDLACGQLGSSGSGNHFVEFGYMQDGSLALLSHSGSRGFGYKLGSHFMKLAAKNTPKMPLAWLDMGSELGQAYWAAMQISGSYARANHRVIHRLVGKALGVGRVDMIFNSHNFAWVEEVDGEPLYVHRKGATPAGMDVRGIVPTSMASPAFVVRGLGDSDSIASCPHGAGRVMSRTEALANLTVADQERLLAANGVTLIDGVKEDTLDESPEAYKDWWLVEAAMVGAGMVVIDDFFMPQIVKMDG